MEIENAQAPKESLIETAYIGEGKFLKGTKGEAFFDFTKNTWSYRPFQGMWNRVEANELECSNDLGWVRGNYLGQRNISKVGKAYWSEADEAWVYKPKGLQRTFIVQEKDFEMVRDEDY
jgi:hypothetical protein